MPPFRRALGLLAAGVLAAAGGSATLGQSAAATPPGLGQIPAGYPRTLPSGATGAVVAGPGAPSAGYATRVVVIPQGTPLTFVNVDQLSHTVTARDRGADGRPLFDGSALPGSTSVVNGVERLAPGTYVFSCSFHPNMVGTLIVVGSGGGTAPVPPTFRAPLRIPPTITSANAVIPIKQADVQVLPTGPKTAMITYGGSYPGPTIRRPSGSTTRITFVNQLPQSLGALTAHFHGDHHASADDGQPDSQLVKPGSRRTYTYPMKDGGAAEPSATNFYHDHLMHQTGRNVWNGLQGMFITDNPADKALGLPSGAYDVPLLISDRTLDQANQLTQPFPREGATPGVTDKYGQGQFSPPGDATVGDRVLVNGGFQPHFDVEARRYRFHVVNGSNFQSYTLHLTNGGTLTQVGAGPSLLPAPVSRTDILLGPAQRADVVIDFTSSLGKRVELESIARTDPNPTGIGTPSTPLLQFRVTRPAKGKDTSRVPATLRPLAPLAAPATPTMSWVFGLGGDVDHGTFWAVNGRAYDPARVDATVPLGSVQSWSLTNVSPITHYIHLHEEQWRTLSRNGQPPPAWEAGLTDTWKLDPGETVVVAARFTDHTGPFMIHCHMLDHEDHGMMATFVVTKAGTAATRLPPATPAQAQADAAHGLAGHPAGQAAGGPSAHLAHAGPGSSAGAGSGPRSHGVALASSEHQVSDRALVLGTLLGVLLCLALSRAARTRPTPARPTPARPTPERTTP